MKAMIKRNIVNKKYTTASKRNIFSDTHFFIKFLLLKLNNVNLITSTCYYLSYHNNMSYTNKGKAPKLSVLFSVTSLKFQKANPTPKQ